MKYIDLIVRISLYLCLMAGLFAIFQSSWRELILFAKGLKTLSNNKASKSLEMTHHLNSILQVVTGKTGETAAEAYVLLSLFIFLLSFITSMRLMTISGSFFTALAAASVPYCVLLIRLSVLRVEASFEGERVVSELLNQYKLTNFNMLEAIDATVSRLDDAKRTKRLLFAVSYQLKNANTSHEVRRVLDRFTYGVDTEWSRMLINNIMLALEHEFVVTSGLNDILEGLGRAKTAYEKSQRETAEGFVIAKWLVPCLYLITLWMAVKFFGFTVGRFFEYQFFTASGMRLFIVNMILAVLNYGLMALFQQRKFDIP